MQTHVYFCMKHMFCMLYPILCFGVNSVFTHLQSMRFFCSLVKVSVRINTSSTNAVLGIPLPYTIDKNKNVTK